MLNETRICYAAILCVFLLAFVQPCSAQRPHTMQDTSNVLIVNVVYANQKPAGDNILVQLESPTGGTVQSQSTDERGQVIFYNLPTGSYIVRVRSGKVKEAVSRVLNVDAFDLNEYIQVVPNEAVVGVGSTAPSGGPVSANELQIPAKARKQFDQGKDSMAKGEDKTAIEYFQKAVELYPQYAAAYNNMGTVYIKSNDRVHAREAWTKALSVNPNLDSANVNLARLDLMENKFADALPLLEKVLAVQPQNAQMLMFMCQAQLMTGHFDQVLIYVKKLHAIDHHQYMLAHLYAGRIHEAQKHPDLAREEYETLLKEAPDCPEADEARKSIARLDEPTKK